ncbi:hypothetical protein ACFYWY_34320 [Streptomyces sp. NPDC002870]|uniref:hypothetical protein n=1 Tax=Streptomyces sp. NPDC002870 TaxID=3364666 RepID=UPI00369107E0
MSRRHAQAELTRHTVPLARPPSMRELPGGRPPWSRPVAASSPLPSPGIRLGVATGTVRSHVSALLGGPALRGRVQATIPAYETGLIRPHGAVREVTDPDMR